MQVEMVISIDISGFTLLASQKINPWNDPKSISSWLYILCNWPSIYSRTNASEMGWVGEKWSFFLLQTSTVPRRELKQMNTFRSISKLLFDCSLMLLYIRNSASFMTHTSILLHSVHKKISKCMLLIIISSRTWHTEWVIKSYSPLGIARWAWSIWSNAFTLGWCIQLDEPEVLYTHTYIVYIPCHPKWYQSHTGSYVYSHMVSK